MAIRRFEDIEAWRLARQLCERIHGLCISGPLSKDFALKDQIQRSSGSAMDNIAEGFDGGSNAEFVRFLAYAQRSCREVQSQLYRGLDRNHFTNADFNTMYELADHTHRKIGGFIKYLKSCSPREKGPARPRRTANEEQRTENEERGTKNEERHSRDD